MVHEGHAETMLALYVKTEACPLQKVRADISASLT